MNTEVRVGRRDVRRRVLPALAIVIGVAPLAVLLGRLVGDTLGANPIEEITHTTGKWTLRFLLLSLAITPARRLLHQPALAPLRRSFGLVAFGYAVLHLLTYVVLDQGLAWSFLLEDVSERRYITAGFAAFLCLLPLALTSTRRAQRRLGSRWRKLHRLAYVAGVLGVVHYLWLVKADLLPPLAHAAILGVLFVGRLRVRPRTAC